MVGSAFCTAKESISIALAGPIVNFLFTVVFYSLGVYFDNVLLAAFGVVQFLVGAINLLPVKGLDGGTVLTVLLEKYCKRNVALIVKLVSFCVSVGVLVLGIAVAVKNTSNPSLLLLGIYLIILNISRMGLYD
jgi:Zn-dependent protease